MNISVGICVCIHHADRSFLVDVDKMLKKSNSHLVISVLVLLAVIGVLLAGRFSVFESRSVVPAVVPAVVPGRQGRLSPELPARFTTLPPGSALPTEQNCAQRVPRSSWEPRPDNYTANHSVPTANQISKLKPWDPTIGLDAKADTFRKQITGNFTGTTDEILQWAACKWGIDEDIVRAEAVQESDWHQSETGDWTTNSSQCPPGTWNGIGCYQSYGILQIKYIDDTTVWPMNRDNTAFNAEYTYGLIRTCYEGWTTYLSNDTPLPGYPSYHSGDLWGCIGMWYSGNWYDQGAIDYINSVKANLAAKPWLQPWF